MFRRISEISRESLVVVVNPPRLKFHFFENVSDGRLISLFVSAPSPEFHYRFLIIEPTQSDLLAIYHDVYSILIIHEREIEMQRKRYFIYLLTATLIVALIGSVRLHKVAAAPTQVLNIGVIGPFDGETAGGVVLAIQ